MGFIAVHSNFDGSIKDVATVSDLWRLLAKIDTPRLYSFCWHSTPFGIARRSVAVTPPMISLRLIKIS